jgi:hypothetical protein
VADPPAQACRYFDPEPITVPADPSTLTTAVMIVGDPTLAYADALTAATNPAAWNVLSQTPVTVAGHNATRIEATSTAGSPGVPVNATRYGYLIDIAGKSAWIQTVSGIDDPVDPANKTVVDLIASQATISPVVAP